MRAYDQGWRRREKRETTWFDLSEVMSGCGRNEAVCLIGDLNAKVGDVVSADWLMTLGVRTGRPC